MPSDFHPDIETRPAPEIRRYQDQRLRDLMPYLNHHSLFYRDLFRRHRIEVDKVSGVSDLIHIPVTTKEDLQRRHREFICVDRRRIVDFITTSGTLGEPVTVVMTSSDLDRLAYNEALSFTCAGGGQGEVYQLMTTIDRCFMAGLAYFLGLRMMGAGIVRVGNGVPELQWDTIHRMAPEWLVAVPSFLLKMLQYAQDHGIDYRTCSVRKAVCIGEPLRNQDLSWNTLARKIQETWPITLHSTYASTEMATSFTECSEGCGGHHHPELIIVEFLDDDNRPVRAGEAGEVTVTTLGIEGMPLLRFKTGDVCIHYTEPCSCGRTTLRLGPIVGRKNQMIKFKGTTLYPPALYEILDGMEGVESYIVEAYTNQIGTDEILIHLVQTGAGSVREEFIKEHFRARVRVTPQIQFHTEAEFRPMQLPETKRKAVKFIDNRLK